MTIRHFHHFGMIVPDLAVAQEFYADCGLETFERDGALIVRCFGRDQDQIVLTEGKSKRFHYPSFGTDALSFAQIEKGLKAEGIALVDPPQHGPNEGLWFRDFENMLTNIRIAEETPWDIAPRVHFNTPEQRHGRKGRSELIAEKMIRPRRLGHIVLYSSDPTRKMDFYNRLFATRLTDRVASLLSFLHTPTGSDHHIIAFAQSTHYALQHVGFDAGTSDEAAAAARILLNKGYVGSWGPGRHFVGSNVFAYVRDPWNSLLEFFADMDYIAEGEDWEPRDWEEVGMRSIWGENQTLDFATNFERP